MKSGAVRRRLKHQRRLARLAVLDFRAFRSEMAARFEESARRVRRAASSFNTAGRAQHDVGGMADVSQVMNDYSGIARYVEAVFVSGTLPPKTLELSRAEFESHKRRVRRWLPRVHRIYDVARLQADLDGVRAAAVAAAWEPKLHSVVQGFYRLVKPMAVREEAKDWLKGWERGSS